MRRFKRLDSNHLVEVNRSGKQIAKPISREANANAFSQVSRFLDDSNNNNYRYYEDSSTNTSPSRMAGEQVKVRISPEDMDDLTKRWEDYERSRNLPNYYGRNETQWKEDNRQIRDELIRIDRAGGNYNDKYEELLDMGFRQDKEIENIIKNLFRKRVLHTQHIGLAGNVADEKLSKAVLDYSGFSPVRLENEGDPTATDLVARLSGVDRYIDAQSRIKDMPMNVELTKFNPQAYDIMDSNPGLSLLELAKTIKDRIPDITESKFFETRNRQFNPIQGYRVRHNPNFIKDYLISSDRRGMGFTNNPYDKILPMNWDLVDLNKAREILLPLTRQQMFDKYGVELSKGRRSNNPVLYLPDRFVKEHLIDTRHPLNPDAVRQLTQ